MGCNSCGKRNVSKVDISKHDIFGGMSIKSLNNRQIEARVSLFKRKFCKKCGNRYKCDYEHYLVCKGLYPT